jgi:hypothetical protein
MDIKTSTQESLRNDLIYISEAIEQLEPLVNKIDYQMLETTETTYEDFSLPESLDLVQGIIARRFQQLLLKEKL